MLTSGIGWPCVAYEFVRKGGNGISNRLSNILKAPLSSVQILAKGGKGSEWKRVIPLCTYVHRTVPASRREVPV